MTELLTRLWRSIRGNGWFTDQRIGNIFPFPQAWQGWAICGGFLALLIATILLHTDSAIPLGIALCVAYIAFGMLTYERR